MPKLRIGPPLEPPVKPPKNFAPRPEPALFEQLLPCSWRDLNIPISSIRVTVAQDLVEHKYWGVDAASVEATGRAPMTIEATIPFVNGIVPGKGETFGVLYPDVFRKFLKSFAEKTSGVLYHPELGPILCKPHSISFDHNAQRRDGVEATAHWVETLDLDADGEFSPFENASPIQAAQLAALDLDASQEDLTKLVPEAAFPDETFDSLVNKVTGFVDSVSSTAAIIANKPKQIEYRINRLRDSVDRARNAMTWPVEEACQKMLAALHDLQSPTTVSNPRPIARFTVPSLMPVAALPGALPSPNTVDDLIKLNPRLASGVAVLAGKNIYYYA